MFEYEFMRHALAAILIAGILSGVVGYFMLLRRLAFAAHALGHVSFTGSTLALICQFSPIGGQLIATLSAAALMGAYGEKLARRDTAVAMVLSLMLGLGVLFLQAYQGAASTATSLLFGDVLGVSLSQLYWMGGLALAVLVLLSIIRRRLLYASLAPQLAQAKGIRTALLGSLFLVLVAITVTVVTQVVGALLVFVLLVGPAAVSLHLTRGFWSGLAVSVLIAILAGGLSLVMAFELDWPVSACLTLLLTLMYFVSGLMKRLWR